MTTKCQFRARALEPTKSMPVYHTDELPDLPDFAANSRAVPQMPTGMEKEEEGELHLQRAMSAQQTHGHTGDLAIPTPEVLTLDEKTYDKLYPRTYQLPKQVIFMQPLTTGFDDDTPEYDLDSEDENWLSRQNIGVSHLQFETMIDRLEKASSHLKVCEMHEAKVLLKQDDDVLIAVYDYWLDKKSKEVELMPQIKTEKRDGSNCASPYTAFRRRIEKMQTRKNRKNDEASYEKMLKVKRDLKKSATLIEMIKKREKLKKEQLHLTLEVFEKRIQASDWTGAIVNETLHQLARQKQQQQQQLARETLYGNKHEGRNNGYSTNVSSHQIRELKARHRKNVQGQRISSSSHKRTKDHQRENSTNGSALSTRDISSTHNVALVSSTGDLIRPELMLSSEEDEEEALSSGTEDPQDMDMSQEPDGMFTFRRKRNVSYLAPLPLGVSLDENDETSRFRRVPSDDIQPHCQFHLVTLQTESDEGDLSGLEDIDPINGSDDATNTENHFMTLHAGRVKALNSIARPPGERRRRKDNYLTFFGRRRLGRGGRIVFDRMPNSPE